MKTFFKLVAKDNVRVVKRSRTLDKFEAADMITNSPFYIDECYRRTRDINPDEGEIQEACDQVFDQMWNELDRGDSVDVGDYYLSKEV